MSSGESESAVADDFLAVLSAHDQFSGCASEKELTDDWCQLCGKNIRHLNPERQALHINRCMDQDETNKASSSVANAVLKPTIPCCPICGQAFKTDNARRAHLKKCATKFDVSIPQLLELVKKQEEEHRQAELEVQATGCTNVSNKRTTVAPVARRKRARKDLMEEPKSKLDEETQLAIALSVSGTVIGDHQEYQSCDSDTLYATGSNTRQQDLFSVMMFSRSSGNAEAINSTKRRKKMQSKEVLPLLSLDQTDLQRKLAERVSDMILASDVHGVSECSDSDSSHFPASRVLSKYFTKATSSEHPKLSALWHESSRAKTSDSYYVEDLAPYVVFTNSSRSDPAVKLSKSLLSHESSGKSRGSSASQTEQSVDRDTDNTLYGSTQTAAVLAELAAEHGDQTFNTDETLVDCESVMGPVQKVPSIGVEPLASDGFCLQSAEEEVSKTAVSDLLISFESLVNSPTYSDLRLRTAGEQIVYAHRSLLGARCPRLLQMADTAGVVHLEDFTQPAILALIRYLYVADVKIPVSVVLEVHRMANRFQLSTLFCICDDLIKLNGVGSELEGDCSSSATIETASGVKLVPNEDECVAADEESEISEVYTFFATQRQKQETEDKAEIESETDYCTEDGSDMEPTDSVNVVKSKRFDSLLSMDSDICLSQALLRKLEESFTSSGGHKDLDCVSVTDNAIEKLHESILSVPSVKSTTSDSSVKEHALDTSNAIDEQDDPCAGYYDCVNVEEERMSFSKSEAGEALAEKTFRSTYSAASPMSLFDEDSLMDTHGLKCVQSPSSRVVVETSVHKTLTRCVQSSNDNQTPAKAKEDSNDLQVFCASPDDLFESSFSPRTDLVVEKSSLSSPDSCTSHTIKIDSVRMESVDCCEDEWGKRLSSQLGVSAADDITMKDAYIPADPLCGESRPTYRGMRQVRVKSRSMPVDVNEDDLLCPLELDRSCFSQTRKTQRCGVEAENDKKKEFSNKKSDIRLHSSQLSVEVSNTQHSAVPSHTSAVDAEIIILDDEDSNTLENSILQLENIANRRSASNTDSQSSPENNSIQICRNEISKPEGVDQVSMTEIYERIDDPPRSLKEGESEVSMCDVWEGFDEGNAAYVPGVEIYTPYKTGVSPSMSPHVSLNRVRTGSPRGPLFRPKIDAKYFVTPTSSSKPMTSESSPITHYSNSSPKMMIRTSHRFNFNSPDSSFTMISTEMASPKASALSPKNSKAAGTSVIDYQCSVALDVQAYSPPTDIETDVSELLEQFAANEDDSFTALNSSVSVGKTSMTPSRDHRKTPVLKRKKICKINDATPLPDYRQMATPALKMHCGKFGVRALPKKSMIKVLENIYYGTHPTVEAPKEPPIKAARKKGAVSKSTKAVEEKLQTKIADCKSKKKINTPSDSAQQTNVGVEMHQINDVNRCCAFNKAGTSSQMDHTKPSKQKASCASQKASPSSESSHSTSSKQKASCVSQNASTSSESDLRPIKKEAASNNECESSDSSDESDRESVPEESVMYSPVSPKKKRKKCEPVIKLDEAAKKMQLQDYITSNKELYTRILLFEPLEIEKVTKQLKEDGIKQNIKEIMAFFDDRSIVYRNNSNGWKSKSRKDQKQKKLQVKNSASQRSNNETE